MSTGNTGHGAPGGLGALEQGAAATLAGGTRRLKIGDLSRRLDVTTRTLRYWEERGLLPPARRTAGGMRMYGEEHVRAARGLMRLKHAGFSLDEINGLNRDMQTSGTALRGMTSLAAAISDRERQIRDHIREQEALLAELQAARLCVGLCDGCHGKVFDSSCITCLTDASGHTMPDCLRSLLETASVPRKETV